VVTVFFDLAIAVIAGVIASALNFAWENATRIRVRKSDLKDGARLYEVWGPLFFGSTTHFQEKFTPGEDPDYVIVDFKDSRIADHSGIEAVQKLTGRYSKIGKEVRLRHLSADCRRLLDNAGDMVEINIIEDPHYVVVTDDA
jgi:SulP family sulfate permease